MHIPLAGCKDSNWPPLPQWIGPKEWVSECYSFSLQHHCYEEFFYISVVNEGLQKAKEICHAALAGQSLTRG